MLNRKKDERLAHIEAQLDLIADLLSLETAGGLAAVMSEVREAKAAAETAREAMKMLTTVLQPKTPMVRKGRKDEP